MRANLPSSHSVGAAVGAHDQRVLAHEDAKFILGYPDFAVANNESICL
jgi:hypothetical protein